MHNELDYRIPPPAAQRVGTDRVLASQRALGAEYDNGVLGAGYADEGRVRNFEQQHKYICALHDTAMGNLERLGVTLGPVLAGAAKLSPEKARGDEPIPPTAIAATLHQITNQYCELIAYIENLHSRVHI